IISTLRLIQNNLNHAKNHATAFRYAEEIVPRWKKQSPAMVQRLANCFYQAILRHGEPTDLPRFRRTFGPPLDDPSFFRLEADVMESCNALDVSVEKWIKYSQWLETKPAGWPLSVLVRLRAMIHLRISNILQDLPPDDSVLAPTKPKRKPASAKAQHRQPEVDPLYHLQLAATLSPDWIEPQLAWGGTLFQLGRLLEAEAVLQAALNWHPKSVAILKSLVLLSHKSQRWDAKLDYLARAIAADPLNPVFRSLAVRTHQTYARQLGLAGNFTEAEQHLQQSLSLSQPQETAPIQTMMAVLARKVGRTADAENWSQQALANTSNNLTVALIMSVESQLFKLKPADKRPIDQKLKELLATNHPQAHAVTTTIKCLVMYREDGVTYRGQTTHEKTLLALALKAAQSDTASPEIVFENLAEVARYIENRTAVTKILRQLEYRFPENPVFPFIQAEWLLEQLGPDRSRYQIAEMLDTAYDLAKTSSEARHQNLLSRIEELLEKVRPQSFMDIFFD
ncbi:MAG: hypothetical protein LC104_00985, partial [Bacteroidales bacterium]|nr:hypothetical protein [Bacteroidales bacterium]